MTEHEHKARKKPIKVPVVHNRRVETAFWKNKHTPGKYTPQALREIRAKQTAEALEANKVPDHICLKHGITFIATCALCGADQ